MSSDWDKFTIGNEKAVQDKETGLFCFSQL